MITERTWHDLISIWQGLNKVRFALSSIQATGLQKIDQAYLDRSFSEHKFRLIISHKDQLISALKNHDSNSTLQLDESLRLELEEAKRWLEEMGDEITLDKTTDNFHYQYILKDEPSKDFLTGFIKIESLSDPSHKGLLSWQDANSPILFLAEIKAGIRPPKILTPEDRAKRNQYQREYRAKNSEKLKADRKQWRLAQRPTPRKGRSKAVKGPIDGEDKPSARQNDTNT